MMQLPRLYPILDAGTLARSGIILEDFARELREAGIRFLQYRDKHATDRELLEHAARLRAIFPAADSTLILNDRIHLLEASRFDGLHIGQEDTSAGEARQRIGARLLGVSTHTADQLQAAERAPVDYVAIGPVFDTQSKLNPDPVLGLEGISALRALTAKPLVAIGGITLDTVRGVLGAGADSVALISALLPTAQRTTAQVLGDLHDRMG